MSSSDDRKTTDEMISLPNGLVRALPAGSPYTVGDIVDAMQRCVERHLSSARDRAALSALEERSWIQLAVAAMLVTARGRNG
jgi:hypothetical protein